MITRRIVLLGKAPPFSNVLGIHHLGGPSGAAAQDSFGIELWFEPGYGEQNTAGIVRRIRFHHELFSRIRPNPMVAALPRCSHWANQRNGLSAGAGARSSRAWPTMPPRRISVPWRWLRRVVSHQCRL